MSITLATFDDARAIAQVHVQSWQHAYRERLSTEFLAALSVEKPEAMRPERIVQGSPEADPRRPAAFADRWRQALAVMDNPTKCGCNHSLAVVCAVFAGAAVALFLAEDRCLDNGGRLSDVVWSCELAIEGIASLWSLITPGNVVAVVAVVSIPVYFAVSAIGRRWIFAYGKRRG